MSSAGGLKLAPFDAADYLTTPELVVEYLNAALAENDSAFLGEALETIARAPAMQGLAEQKGFNSSSANAGARPDFAAILRLVAAMGLKLQAVAA